MDTVTLVGRLLISLAAVLGVLWLLGRRLRKSGRGRASGLIEVLSRQQLSRTSSVAVVRVGEQALVLGVTDNQVSVLGETDLDAATAAQETATPAAVARSLTARTGRTAAAGRRRAGARTASPAAPAAATAATTTAAATTADAPARATQRTTAVPAGDITELPESPTTRSPLAGSAISPQTWKQTIESLRELTTRS